jgi:nucleoside-diphosphate-sugar epimerase
LPWRAREGYCREYGSRFISVLPTACETCTITRPEAKLAGAPHVTLQRTGAPCASSCILDCLNDASVFLMRTPDDARLMRSGWGHDIAIRDLRRALARGVGYDGRIERDAISQAARRASCWRRLIADIMGAEIDLVTEEERLRPEKSEVNRLKASTTKAQELLGWQPRYGDGEGFRSGLAETVAWFQDPRHLAHCKAGIYTL